MSAQLNTAAYILSSDMIVQIDLELKKYPANQRQSAVMSALRIVQTVETWLSTAMMDAVAQYIGMPAIAVYEVATFYEMFETSPVGKHKITLCTNLPCALSGALDALTHLQNKLNIKLGETTADGRFTLKEGECFGACGDAPVFLLNNHKMCSWMTPEKIDQFLAALDNSGGAQ